MKVKVMRYIGTGFDSLYRCEDDNGRRIDIDIDKSDQHIPFIGKIIEVDELKPICFEANFIRIIE